MDQRIPISPAFKNAHQKLGDVALVSANIGNYDSLKALGAETIELLNRKKIDRLYFSDNAHDLKNSLEAGYNYSFDTSLFLKKLPPRLKAKIFKIRPHIFSFFANYKKVIWLDASLEIYNNYRAGVMIDQILDSQTTDTFFGFIHSRTIKEEFEFIRNGSEGKNKSSYLKKIFESEPLQLHLDTYENSLVNMDSNMYLGAFFARTLSNKCNLMCDYWWDQNIILSSRDQISLPVALYKYDIKPIVFAKSFGSTFNRTPHIGF